ncbi:MAG: hypothetical protein ACFFDT_12215 [Candidatus Hodarchaeota archaeon]
MASSISQQAKCSPRSGRIGLEEEILVKYLDASIYIMVWVRIIQEEIKKCVWDSFII